jgi:hypothetical protein
MREALQQWNPTLDFVKDGALPRTLTGTEEKPQIPRLRSG